MGRGDWTDIPGCFSLMMCTASLSEDIEVSSTCDLSDAIADISIARKWIEGHNRGNAKAWFSFWG